MKINEPMHRVGSVLKYRGYSTISQYSKKDRCFHGKLENIRDCIMFEGQRVEELVEAFQNSVDEYIDWLLKES